MFERSSLSSLSPLTGSGQRQCIRTNGLIGSPNESAHALCAPSDIGPFRKASIPSKLTPESIRRRARTTFRENFRTPRLPPIILDQTSPRPAKSGSLQGCPRTTGRPHRRVVLGKRGSGWGEEEGRKHHGRT